MISSLRNNKWLAGLATALFVVGSIAALTLLAASRQAHNRVKAGTTEADTAEHEIAEEDEPAAPVKVKTVRPRHDATLEVRIDQPAYVEAYYRAELLARVAGPVKFIQKDIGDAVAPDERLVEIDVPDLTQEVEQKKAVVEQRKCDLRVTEANVRIFQAAQDASAKSVQVSESRVKAAEEEKEFRRKEYVRFKQLATGPQPAVTPDVVDERLKWYNVAQINRLTADIDVLKARADLEEAKQKVEGAQADVDLKKSLIQVAEEDRKRAQAGLDLATIRAPFRGVITRRTVDPGTFVHNAATSVRVEPMLTIERTDIVTVFMRVPDRYAPYVSRDTEAIIEMAEMPGEQIRAKVTRFTPSLQTPEHDRTMRVEVDLYNGSQQEYQDFLAHSKANNGAELKGDPQRRVLPIFPTLMGKNDTQRAHPLLPGMYGKMRLILRKFKDVYLLPSQAIVNQGGTAFIFQAVDGVVHRVQVVVEVDDGKLARVLLVGKNGDTSSRSDLSGLEEIVISNQGELSDGQAVEAIHGAW